MIALAQSAEIAPKKKRKVKTKSALKDEIKELKAKLAEPQKTVNDLVVAPAAAVQSDTFEGLSANDCPFVCTAEKCCISTKGYCGHPFKGGLRYGDMNNREAIVNMQKAKRLLEHQKVELKFNAG
jgi:hypothetical protein